MERRGGRGNGVRRVGEEETLSLEETIRRGDE